MIQIFYSTPEKNTQLKDTTLSLGGFVSQNSFLNNKKDSLFPIYSELENSDCRLLVLKNIGTTQLVVTALIEYTSSLVDYDFGVVIPSIDPCSLNVFELIDTNSDPLYVNLQKGDIPINFNFLPNTYLGVWVKRYKRVIIDTTTTEDSCNIESLPLISDKLVESFNLKLTWL